MNKDIVKFESEKEIQRVSQDILSEAKALVIDSQPKYAAMISLMGMAKMAQKKIDEFFEPIRLPAYEALQAVYDKIRTAKEPFVQVEKLAKQRAGGWDELQRKKAAEQTAKQAAKAEAKGEIAPPPVENKARQVDGVSYRENYEVEPEDLKAFYMAIATGLLPTTMAAPVLVEVKKYANATKGQIPIPGWKVFRRDTVVAR